MTAPALRRAPRNGSTTTDDEEITKMVRTTASSRASSTALRERPRARATGTRQHAPMDADVFAATFDALVGNIERVIKGKTDQVRMALVALLADGHVLLEDMPGTGKTMLARAIAQSINASWNRVQCTPDLLPSDLTGAPVYNQQTQDFYFREGPAFANILLVDEINRATPKTQSALLEAMAERNVTVGGITHALPKPFLVLATQNPIELAGTFPLPEAQLDRFLLKLNIGYPDRAAEMEVLQTNRAKEVINDLGAVIDLSQIVEMVQWATGVEVSEPARGYIVDLCQATRTDAALLMGASPRASLSLMRAARVLAASQGREDVLPDDVKALIRPVLAHRLILTPDAALRDETLDNVIDRIITRVKVPMGARD